MLRFYHRINTSNMYLKFMQAHRDQRQSNDLNLIWFGCIIYPSQWGGGKQFSCLNVVFLPLLRPEGGGGGWHPVRSIRPFVFKPVLWIQPFKVVVEIC
jgi:hypothetical protein